MQAKNANKTTTKGVVEPTKKGGHVIKKTEVVEEVDDKVTILNLKNDF